MSEDLNQKVSQFLDNELDNVQALNLLKKIQLQSELQDKLSRYEAVSYAMKTEIFLLKAIVKKLIPLILKRRLRAFSRIR